MTCLKKLAAGTKPCLFRHVFVFFFFIKRDEDMYFKTWRRARGTGLIYKNNNLKKNPIFCGMY